MRKNYFMVLAKRTLAAGILAIGAMAMTGCHGAKDTVAFSVPDEFDTTVNHEITFWAKNDTNKSQVNIYEKAASDFEAIYPNVKVNIKFYTDYGKIYNDVITNISTGTTPNVCITYPDHIATYLTGDNQVVALDELFTNPEYGFGGSKVGFDSPKMDEIIPQFLNECVIDGHYYAVPYMRSTEALYINKTYVEQMGYTIPDVVTWDFVWEVSEAATEKDADGLYKVNGQNVMIPFIYKSTDNMMIQILKQKNADYSTKSGEVLLFNDVTKDFLFDISRHVKSGAFSTFKISSYPGNFLNAGQCLFAIDSTAGATWMGTDAPLSDICSDDIVPFETVVRMIPQVDIDNPTMISQGPSVCVFNKEDPQEVLASWLFVQYLLSNDIQIPYAKTEGYVPVTGKAQKDPAYIDYLSRGGEDNKTYYQVKIDATQMLLDNIDNTFVTPVFVGSASVRDAAGQLIENTAKSTRRKQTVDDEYIEKLYADVISLYRLDQISAGDGSGINRDLGPLPKGAKALLISLGAVWVLIISYVGYDYMKRKKSLRK